ncbi:MAG TPA: PIG-L family deacetylase, partial [Niabella sp.]|nr:PIG-L family deacetylase [Niabella sp.]
MKMRFLIHIALLFIVVAAKGQSSTASQILQDIKKLKVLGSVLYVAAHPDDENTRLITYLANDKLYRTGYLSLTRGDGGQNLIGDEQGVELGLIRTQELLAARRIDGGEQFFTRAYDFGFSKNPEETFTKWKKDKVLADVVWVIRKFQPDVIITRFPATGEGGHGHHTASAILAEEAFKAAADPSQFPEQLKYVKPWQAKRILWNTFNFGGNNTTDPSQFNINVGGYNSLLGKSYGEIAAQSRSQHKSQGFGSAATRGESYEYFRTIGGDAPQKDLLDGVDVSWSRIGKTGSAFQKAITAIENRFDAAAPQKSVPALVALYKMMDKAGDHYWISRKKEEVQQLVAQCSGLYMDAYTNQTFAVQTTDIGVSVIVNNRLGTDAVIKKIFIDDIAEDVNKV